MGWIRKMAGPLLAARSMRVVVLGMCEAAGWNDWWGVGYCDTAAAPFFD